MDNGREGTTISFSEIDSERFGMRIARAHIAKGSFQCALDFCATEGIKMLIARCSSNDVHTAQGMEASGFLLMDTLVYYSFDLAKRTIPDDSARALVRKFRMEDSAEIQRVAGAAFRGYYGHYHADPRLDRTKCDEGYVSWAVRSCTSRQVATEVLVAELDSRVVGFATLRLNSTEEGEGVLFGVAPEAQGLGIYRSFMVNGMQWCGTEKVQRMMVSTQITNTAVQKVWCRIGFEPAQSYYTFHKWF